jgi:hypothetical protein
MKEIVVLFNRLPVMPQYFNVMYPAIAIFIPPTARRQYIYGPIYGRTNYCPVLPDTALPGSIGQ